MPRIVGRTARILCLAQALALPAIAAETPAAGSKLAEHVAEMFQVGYARGAKAFQESQRLYDSLRSESHNNPRVDYAHGLVLLKLLRNKEAKADFLIATKRSGTPFTPAWQALIWSNFVAREFDDGYDHLVEFAKLLQTSHELTNDVRRDEAYWIGRVMAALEMGLDSVQSREAWMQSESKLIERLGSALIDVYNDGKEEVHAKHLVLEDSIRQSREKEKQLQGKKIEELGKSLDAAETKRDNLKRSAAELKEEYAEQSATFKKQMERMEKDYALMERRNMTLLTQMLTFDQQINLIQNNRSVNTTLSGLAALQNRRALLDTEFQLTVNATQQLSGNAQKLSEEQAELTAQYEKATGDIVKEEAGVKKWKERTEKHAEELKKVGKKLVGPATALNAQIQAATSFRTYIDLDLAFEREKVLQSLAPAPLGN